MNQRTAFIVTAVVTLAACSLEDECMREIVKRLPDIEPWFMGNVMSRCIGDGEPVPDGWVAVGAYNRSKPGTMEFMKALARAEEKAGLPAYVSPVWAQRSTR